MYLGLLVFTYAGAILSELEKLPSKKFKFILLLFFILLILFFILFIIYFSSFYSLSKNNFY